jgi:hypothetical protein
MKCRHCETEESLRLLDGTNPSDADEWWVEQYRCEQCKRIGWYCVDESKDDIRYRYAGCVAPE